MATAFSTAPSAPGTDGPDPTAVFGRRVVAGVIDLVVVAVPGVAISSTAFKSYDISDADLDGQEFCEQYMEQYDGVCAHVDDTAYFAEGGFHPATLAPLGLAILLFVVVQGLTGWTVGKLLMGLRTVKEDGSKLSLGQALVRWVMWIVDGLPCFALVALITAGTSTGHRRVGDIVARTFVVGHRHAGSPLSIPGVTAPTWAAAPQEWAQTAAASAPAVSEPQWDAARGTYIQWDATQAKWLQWDDATRSWTAIPGQ